MMNTPPPFPAARAAAPKTGLSTTSLVLGILSLPFCFNIFAGLPAIITGHMARARAKKLPQLYGGAGMALAGLILGYLSIPFTIGAVAFIAGVVVPAIEQGQRQARGFVATPTATPTCVNNLRQIGLAARIWSLEHNEIFPPDFLTMSNELIAPKILVCPEDKKHTVAADWAHFDPKRNVSFEFLLPNAKEADAMTMPAFRCPIHGHVCFGDGRVQEKGASKRR